MDHESPVEDDGKTSDFIKKLFQMVEEGTQQKEGLVYWNSSGQNFLVNKSAEFSENVLPLYFKHSNLSSFVRQLNKYQFHKIKESAEAKAGDFFEFHNENFRRNHQNLLPLVRRRPTAVVSKPPPPKDAKRVSIPTKKEKPKTPPPPQPPPVQPQVQQMPQIQMQDKMFYTLSSPTNNPMPPPMSFVPSSFSMQNMSTNQFEEMQAQIDNLAKLQSDMAAYLQTLSKNYYVVVDEIVNFRSSLMQQDQVLKNLVEYLVSRDAGMLTRYNSNSCLAEKERAKRSNMSINNMANLVSPPAHSPNFIQGTPSAFGEMSAEKLLSAYQEVSKTQLQAIENISKHVQEGVGLMNNPPGKEKEWPQPQWITPPHVLLVEDDLVCRQLSGKILKLFGCEYTTATNGKEAADLVLKGHNFHLILMDISMPVLDGVTATVMIRKQDARVPIIAMTSSVTEEDCYNYLNHGMNDILAKPFSKDSLWSILTTWCGDLRSGVA